MSRTVEDLQELTGQESGIVIYDGREAILCNWSSIKGLPRVFATGLIGMGENIPEVEGEHSDNLVDLLDGIDIYDYSAEQSDEPPKSGTVYEINDNVTVIAPDDWA